MKGFFDEEERLEKLSKLGDSLEKLNKAIDWEMFRSTLEGIFEKEVKTLRGRPPYDYILMFKILVLQRMYNISDDQTEYQINDRMSFMRFLGLTLGDKVPDAKTIWNFKNELAKVSADEKLFSVFNEMLEKEGIIKHEGVIVDATFVEAPRQRNTREENQAIKEGKIPEEWQNKSDAKMVHKLSHKDTDARWTKKRGESHYGYKNHVKADIKSKIITKYTKTSASVHDSQEMSKLVEENDKEAYADSGYVGQEKELSKEVREKVKIIICKRAYRNKPLTEIDKEENRIISKVRCRVEHIFGFMTKALRGKNVRCVGKVRAYFNIGLTNLIYNMCRYRILQKI